MFYILYWGSHLNIMIASTDTGSYWGCTSARQLNKLPQSSSSLFNGTFLSWADKIGPCEPACQPQQWVIVKCSHLVVIFGKGRFHRLQRNSVLCTHGIQNKNKHLRSFLFCGCRGGRDSGTGADCAGLDWPAKKTFFLAITYWLFKWTFMECCLHAHRGPRTSIYRYTW